MSGATGAIIGGAVISAGASAYAGHQAGSAADSASRRSRDATLTMYNQDRADLAPYREAGYGALDEVQSLFMGSPAERAAAISRFRASPQYNFVRTEGLRGITNAASTGAGLSGNTLEGLTRYSSGLASGEFNSYVDRLFGIAGLGSDATGKGVAASQNTASNLANIYTNQGNARASAYNTTAAGVNNAVQGGLQNWAFNTYMNHGGGNA